MIKGSRKVIYECASCRELIELNVLGSEKVGKVRLTCKFCWYEGSYYGEPE